MDALSNAEVMVRIVLTTSRFWNALATGAMIRAAHRIASAYSHFRHAFGQPIASFPLVEESLDNLERDARNYTAGAFEVLAAWERVARKERAGEVPDGDEAARMRLLVMLAKTCSTRRCTQRVHEAMMLLGGNGIEERFSALPRLWRDSIIMETWEGPHGLLLTRCLMDAMKFGAGDDPHGFTALLLGADGADSPETRALGSQLEALVGEADPRTRMVAFERWAVDFYDQFGALATARVSS